MVMTNPIILYWICSTSVCNHPVGAPTKPEFFLTWACMTVWEKKTIQPSYSITYFQHTRNHTRNTPSKKNTPYRTGKKMVCCAVGKVNELVRTAHFERSKLLRKNNSRVAMKYILGSCRGLCTNFGGDMFGWKESATIRFFLMRKMRIALFHYSHCPFLKYIIWPHNINYCCCFCCRFHAVLIFFPVRVVISVSLQPDIVVSLLFLLLFFLCLFS